MGIFLTLTINVLILFQTNVSHATMREIAKEQYKQLAMAAAIDLALDPALLFASSQMKAIGNPGFSRIRGYWTHATHAETARNWALTSFRSQGEHLRRSKIFKTFNISLRSQHPLSCCRLSCR